MIKTFADALISAEADARSMSQGSASRHNVSGRVTSHELG